VLLIALPMLALTYAIFSDALPPRCLRLPLTFAILPFVIWTALRFGQREVTRAECSRVAPSPCGTR